MTEKEIKLERLEKYLQSHSEDEKITIKEIKEILNGTKYKKYENNFLNSKVLSYFCNKELTRTERTLYNSLIKYIDHNSTFGDFLFNGELEKFTREKQIGKGQLTFLWLIYKENNVTLDINSLYRSKVIILEEESSL